MCSAGGCFKTGKKAFTLVEMLVVIAIIAILASMLAPSLMKALDQTKQISCLNQLRMWGISMQAYSEDFSRHFPSIKIGVPSWTWCEHDDYGSYIGIDDKLQRKKLFTCPSWNGAKNNDGVATSYMLWYPETTMPGTYYAPLVTSVKRPSKMVLLIDARAQNANAHYTWLSSGGGHYTWTVSWVNTLSGMIKDETLPDGSYGDAYRHVGDKTASIFWDLHAGVLSEFDIKYDPEHSAPARAK